jgi:tRNA-(ms[2]io[6]A)-hydroxylase
MVRELPLLSATPESWARLAADNLDRFLADHAICEQQAALSALNLVAHYPDDEELVDGMTALAAEELVHLRRVIRLMRRRGLTPARRRGNPYVQGLRSRLRGVQEPLLKTDRLLVGALIEARSCERFTCLLRVLAEHDEEVAALLSDLGPAERRHWESFHALAARGVPADRFEARWRSWLEWEGELNGRGGIAPTVHG